MESVGRIFVAAGLSPEARVAVGHYLAATTLPGTVVAAEDLHVTLRFLGEVNSVRYDRLLAALDETEWPEAFTQRFGGLGAFPHDRKAGVLWIDIVEGSERLIGLNSLVEDACDRAGLGREDRPFRPHLTVARVRPPVDARPLIERTPPLRTSSVLRWVVVLRSRLDGSKPRYEPLEAFPLAGR